MDSYCFPDKIQNLQQDSEGWNDLVVGYSSSCLLTALILHHSSSFLRGLACLPPLECSFWTALSHPVFTSLFECPFPEATSLNFQAESVCLGISIFSFSLLAPVKIVIEQLLMKLFVDCLP